MDKSHKQFLKISIWFITLL